MTIVYERSFLKDLKKISHKATLSRISTLITQLGKANSISEMPNPKKLQGHHSAYRIKIGSYRIGFFMENEQIILSRCIHRQSIYKRFPRKD